MANYLLAYRGGSMAETAEAQQAAMAAWGKWFEGLGGAVVDGGNPVGAIRTVSNGKVSEGGRAPAISGYSVLKANDRDAAVKMAQGCPVLAVGGSVEVCETFDAM